MCFVTCLSWKEIFFVKVQNIDLIGSYFYNPDLAEGDSYFYCPELVEGDIA